MAHEIIPGLWIGGIDAVASHVCDRHITHVVVRRLPRGTFVFCAFLSLLQSLCDLFMDVHAPSSVLFVVSSSHFLQLHGSLSLYI